jgi:hypothetical protein
MPPKRKALSSTSGNATVDSNNAKAVKTSSKQTASKATAEKKAQKQFKYSDPKTVCINVHQSRCFTIQCSISFNYLPVVKTQTDP